MFERHLLVLYSTSTKDCSTFGNSLTYPLVVTQGVTDTSRLVSTDTGLRVLDPGTVEDILLPPEASTLISEPDPSTRTWKTYPVRT